LNKLSALEPAEPIRRYEREKPGELIHLDIKKLGRIGSVGHRITGRYPGAVNRHHGIGWEFVHVCIDDASRIAFVQVLADQRKESAVAFLQAAVGYYAKLGVRIERVMTDNGSCYRSKTFRAACKRLGLRQVFTKPYTPRDCSNPHRPACLDGALIRLPGLPVMCLEQPDALTGRHQTSENGGRMKARVGRALIDVPPA
jgi:Integrase core domain